MIRIIFFTILIFFHSCSHGNVQECELIQIEFDGAKKEFYKKYNLWQNITSSDEINKILAISSRSTKKRNCRISPVMWEVDAFGGTKKKPKHLFTVGANTDNDINVYDRWRCYENELLIEKITSLVKIEEIRAYQGILIQEVYDEILSL